jgi:hypothetical protein
MLLFFILKRLIPFMYSIKKINDSLNTENSEIIWIRPDENESI